MTVMVVGGAGYIGSHTAHALVRAGWDVVVVDSLETGFRAAIPEKARFYKGSIQDTTFMNGVFAREQVDGVVHFAANSQVGESMEKPLKYYENNLGGTMVLLECMLAHGVNRLVFSSTAAIYGEPARVPVLETDHAAPSSCYGETKRAMEGMIHWVSAASCLRYVALRYFNACGAQPDGRIGEAHDPETHLIPLILQVPAGKREKIEMFGDDYATPDGTCIRDYVHVCDLAQAHILALEYLIRGGKSDTMNLGNGVGFSVREVIEEARRVTGHPIPAVVRPRRAGDPAQLVASAEKAKRVLGWKPAYTELRMILETAWNWHKTRPNGYER